MTEALAKPDPKWRPSSPAVSADQFEDLIAGPPVIIHFWAPWNPYDRPLDENLQKLLPQSANQFAQKFRFYCANADDTAFTQIIDTHHVAALPTLLCFSNSRPRGRFHGLQTPEALADFLTQMSAPQPR